MSRLDTLFGLKASFDAAIDLARKSNRLMQNGIDIKEFTNLHIDADCSIKPELLEVLPGKGAIHVDIDPNCDYTSPAYRYRDRCTKHNVVSAKYDLLTLQ